MIVLIFRGKPLQNGDCVIYGRLIHLNGLEAPLKCRVLFYGLMIFLKGCRAHALQFAACEGRFKDICRVHRPFGTTRTDESMDFVQEKDDIPGAARLIHNAFQALLKLSAILGARDNTRHIDGDNTLGL